MRSGIRLALCALLGVGSGCSSTSTPFMDAAPPRDTAPDAADTAPDVAPDAGPERCGEGIDSDIDGATNDAECAAGTDPFNPDSDGDGLRDGRELRYPRGCVAADRGRQRRPVVACTGDGAGVCGAGETCRGLDATAVDSDGDTVNDGAEDPNGDGMVDPARGETDPRLFDTDGDGRGDGESGIAICRREGLVTPIQTMVPSGDVQVGFDPAWGAMGMSARTVTVADGGAVALDDPAAGVAGLVVQRPAMGDVRDEATRLEGLVATALSAVPVLVGQAITTHEMNPAVTSLFRVATSGTAGALRDRLVTPLAGATAPAGAPAYPTATNFYVEVTTVLRRDTRRVSSIVAVSPAMDYDDVARPTGIRSRDLTNTTGVASSSRALDFQCQRFRAEGTSMADFLWMVDTSGSMSDDQERLGNTAVRFFNGLSAAGVDFRIGVITASAGTINLDTPGFLFINGADPMGARELAWRVTYQPYMRDTADRLTPYPVMGGGTEEPVGSGVVAHETFENRARMGERDLNKRFRLGARVVAFMVTDEPGTNDDTRYFQMNTARWGGDYPTRLESAIEYYRSNNILTFGLVEDHLTPCSRADVRDMPKCVILGNNGAFIPIRTATDAEVSSAMARIVDAVAGSTSQFRLERTPISATLQVTLRGRAVPRSRAEGFDYDPTSRSVVFYGRMYRPRQNDEVVISYRVWAGSLG